ncbi:amidase signature domain-containing protein [Xylogone sp. PMI_703]|nr:amidase signature domain-containing protein [Xylogone sp. PMI_703]
MVTNDQPTTCGSGILGGYKSPFDATVVKALRGKTLIPVGKTNLDEFGMGSHSTNSHFGPVHNKRPFEHYSAGGSSGGSAVAVAAKLSYTALGTDTGGSVRLPAAYTGVVGFKPSYGLISRWGVIPYANSLDTVGILAKSAYAAQNIFYNALQHDPNDPTSVTRIHRERMREHRRDNKIGRRLRIGVPLEYNIAELDPVVRHVWQTVLHLLQDNGYNIVPVSLPSTKHALSAYYIIAPAEAASNLSKYDGVRYGANRDGSDGAGDVLYSNTRAHGFGDEVKRRILLGSYTLSSKAIDNYFIKAQKVRRLVQRDFDRIFALPNPLRSPQQFDLSDIDESIQLESKLGPPEVDLLVCPTAPTTAPKLEDIGRQKSIDAYMNDVFTVPASLAGLPAISIPFEVAGKYKQLNAPASVGIQIIGQYADDFRVLGVARHLESLGHVRWGIRKMGKDIRYPS